VDSAEQALLHDLVRISTGPSFRNMISESSEADRACSCLLQIGSPAVPLLLEVLESPESWVRANSKDELAAAKDPKERESLLRDMNYVARQHAMEVLSQLKDRRAVKPLLAMMKHGQDPNSRNDAAYFLGAFGDRSVIPDLLVAARSGDSNLTWGALSSLAQLHESSVIPTIIANLGSKVKLEASGELTTDTTPIVELTNIGPPAAPALVKFMEMSTGDAQRDAAVSLGRIGSKLAVSTLLGALQNPASKEAAAWGLLECDSPDSVAFKITCLGNERFRSMAMMWLRRHPTKECLPPIEALMSIELNRDKPDIAFLQDALNIVRALNDRSMIPLIIQLLERKKEQNGTLDALAQFRDVRAIPSIVRIVESWRPSIRFRGRPEFASRELSEFGLAGLDGLADLYRRRPDLAPAIVPGLENIKDPMASAKLMLFLSTSNPSAVRAAAIRSLGQIRARRSANAIFASLRDPSKEVQTASAVSLALMGDARAVEPLYRLARSNIRPPLAEAWTALGVEAIPELEKLLMSGDTDAAMALDKIRTNRTTDLLIRGLRSPKPAISEVCARALGDRRSHRTMAALRGAMGRSDIDDRFAAIMSLRKLSARQSGVRPH
jgi:HEAT repeat protein